MSFDDFLAWLYSVRTRAWNVFNDWWDRVRNAFDYYWSQFWYVVVVWYGAAWTFFHDKLNQLQDIVLSWYDRIRAVIYDRWDILWQALTATWGFIWDHFYEGYKDVIDYIYSARADIRDTFTRFKWEFSLFRDDPWAYTTAKVNEARDHIVDRLHVLGWDIEYWFHNYYNRARDLLDRAWEWVWEHLYQWARDILGFLLGVWEELTDFFTNLYHRVADFLSRVWSWIYEHIPQVFKDAWQLIIDHLPNLIFLLVDAWVEFVKFITDPFGYITTLLQAWIEGWRDYILGIVNDLLEQLTREIILHLMDWMSYVAPPIEDLDEMAPHFSPFTDWLEEVALAWKELREGWVLEAMAMMEALAAELRGEEEMLPKRPSQIFWENWWLLPDDVRELINQPPIKG